MDDPITVERRDRQAHLSIGRPPLNILDLTTIRSLRRHLTTLADSERIYKHDLVATEDMQEGLSAFLEKRSPRWRHR